MARRHPRRVRAIWLGEKSSVCTKVIERLYGNSHLLNDDGQYAYYGRVAGCLVTGNEDGVKHCAMNILYSLQHLGYVIPPQADAGWIGEAGPGPSYLDPGSGGPENDFTNRNTTFMTWNLLHLARMLTRPRRHPGPRQPARRRGTPAAASTSRIPTTADAPPCASGRGERGGGPRTGHAIRNAPQLSHLPAFLRDREPRAMTKTVTPLGTSCGPWDRCGIDTRHVWQQQCHTEGAAP